MTNALAVSVPPEILKPENEPAATPGTSRLVSNQTLPSPSVNAVPLVGEPAIGSTPNGEPCCQKQKGPMRQRAG